MSTQDGDPLVPWERCSSVVAGKRQAPIACPLVLKCLIYGATYGVHAWPAPVDAGGIPKAQPPSALVPTPHSGPGWWERAWPGLGQQLPPRNRWFGGKFQQAFRIIDAETIALMAHRWIWRLAPTPGFNVSSRKPSDTLTSLYIIPKKLTASCNWNRISGSSIPALPSAPFTLTLHLLSLHL